MLFAGVYIVLLSPPIVGGKFFKLGKLFKEIVVGEEREEEKRKKGKKCGEEMERGK